MTSPYKLFNFIIEYFKLNKENINRLIYVISIFFVSIFEISMVLANYYYLGYLSSSLESKQFKELIYNALDCMAIYMLQSLAINLNNLLIFKLTNSLESSMLDKYYDKLTALSKQYNNSDIPKQTNLLAKEIDKFCKLFIDLIANGFRKNLYFINSVYVLLAMSYDTNFKIYNKKIYLPGYMAWLSICYSLISNYIINNTNKQIQALQRDVKLQQKIYNAVNIELLDNFQHTKLTNFRLFEQELDHKKNKIAKLEFFINFWNNVNDHFITYIFTALFISPKLFIQNIVISDVYQINESCKEVNSVIKWYVQNLDPIYFNELYKKINKFNKINNNVASLIKKDALSPLNQSSKDLSIEKLNNHNNKNPSIEELKLLYKINKQVIDKFINNNQYLLQTTIKEKKNNSYVEDYLLSLTNNSQYIEI